MSKICGLTLQEIKELSNAHKVDLHLALSWLHDLDEAMKKEKRSVSRANAAKIAARKQLEKSGGSDLKWEVLSLRCKEGQTFAEVAKYLNSKSYPSPFGDEAWESAQVQRLFRLLQIPRCRYAHLLRKIANY
jgi:hypothetical protein